jgi:hypothetical protein
VPTAEGLEVVFLLSEDGWAARLLSIDDSFANGEMDHAQLGGSAGDGSVGEGQSRFRLDLR